MAAYGCRVQRAIDPSTKPRQTRRFSHQSSNTNSEKFPHSHRFEILHHVRLLRRDGHGSEPQRQRPRPRHAEEVLRVGGAALEGGRRFLEGVGRREAEGGEEERAGPREDLPAAAEGLLLDEQAQRHDGVQQR